METVKPWWRPDGGPMGKDSSEFEWETWKRTARHAGPIVVLYPVISQLVRRRFNSHLVTFSALYSVIGTAYVIGVLPVLFVFLQLGFLYLAFLTKSPVFVWFSAIGYILCLNIFPLRNMKEFLFYDYELLAYEGYLTSVITAWINARCVSFALDRIWGRVSQEKTHLQGLLKLTAYCFYMPLCLMGPLVTSSCYEASLNQTPVSLHRSWWTNLVIQVLRYLLWICVTDISLYFLYQHSFSHHVQIVDELSMWALCGMGYMMGQFFQLKYVVMYGTSSLLARLDQVDAPPHPKCIGRIHLYSDMWRYFDSGLHIFMHTYIYQPLVGTSPSVLVRILASVACFSFVYVWHGTMDFVLIWSCLNFLGIAAETLAREIGKTERYQHWESRCLSPQGARRFHALLSSPLFIMSALSNFYFFAGTEIGHTFVRRILLESWPKGFPTLLMFMYCCSQTSIEIKNLEIRRDILAEKDREL